MFQVPHQVAGGEEGLSAVQHAGVAIGPAGRQLGRRRTRTAAAARDRERGVADEDPLPPPSCAAPPGQAPTASSFVLHYRHQFPSCTGTSWLSLWTGYGKK